MPPCDSDDEFPGENSTSRKVYRTNNPDIEDVDNAVARLIRLADKADAKKAFLFPEPSRRNPLRLVLPGQEPV